MKKHLLKTLFVAAAMAVSGNVWAQTTWNFLDTETWGAEGITLNGGAQYDESANAVTSGGVTFKGTSGFVATAKGIGFNAVGSTSDENISIVVPAGYKVAVSISTSSNRTVVGSFGGATQTFNASWASSTKEFNNAEGEADVTLYLYCNQNAGGADQKKAPFLEKIVLTDMLSAKAYPWSANAVATIDGTKTTIKTYSSEKDVVEGSQYTVIVDKAIKFGDNYYALNDTKFAENVFGATFTMGNAAAELELNYEKIDNAVFFGEVEDIFTSLSNGNKVEGSAVLSNGVGYSAMSSKGGYVKLAFSIPEDGKYDLQLGMNNTNDRDRGFNYAIDDADVSETITVSKNSAYVHEIIGQELTAGEHTITMNITYSLTPVFDYLLIKKSEASVTFVNTAGWEKVYVYTWTNGSGDQNAAWPGVEIAKTGTETINEVDYDVYTYSVTADNAPGFIIFNNGSGVQTEDLPFVNGAIYSYNGIVTAIEHIKSAATNGIIYNIAGQQVTKAQKGLYIVNGKKVIK